MDVHIKKYLAILVLLVVLPSTTMAAPLWSDVAASQVASTPESKQPDQNPHAKSRRVSVDLAQLNSALSAANLPAAGQVAKTLVSAQIKLPMPDGSQQVFNIVESPIMAPELAVKYPQIKTYKATAENDASISGRLDIGPNGFHGYLFTDKGEVFIDPVPASAQQQYYSYYKHDYMSKAATEFSCGVKTKSASGSLVYESPLAEFKNSELLTAARTGGANDFLSYRIAVAATGEYTQQVAGGNKTTAFNEITTAINRITGIYERDLAIQLILVNDDQIIYTNPATDPYTDQTDQVAMLGENQAILDSVIGAANYDIGHLFTTKPGGLAVIEAACFPGYKAQGVSGLTDPTGDPFYVDIVAHEIGHQLGANHTFNGTTGSCAGNRSPATAFEPGSGSSIMSYAGLCDAEDTALSSDAVFHAGSIAEIISYTRTGDGSTCPAKTSASAAPIVNVAQNCTNPTNCIIPGGTAFTLTGSATDTEALTYQWDQMDAGTATSAVTHGTDNGSNALFRAYLPVATPERTFPTMATLLGTNPDPLAAKAETLPTENRTLNFRFTVRDNNGGVDEDDMQVTVNGNAGPFEIRQPNTNVNLNPGLQHLVEWNTACTEDAPINCANVDILYSSDGGTTFTSVVAGTTPNDGSQLVSLPAGTTTTARIKIACTDNIFFDVSDVNFQVSNTGGSLTATGTAPSCGTATGAGNTGDDIEPNNSTTQAQTLTFPSTLNGTVNNILDPDDYFTFVANPAAYNFSLSNYGSNDLDLILIDDTGKTVVASESYNPTETINIGLISGKTYYLIVSGYDTYGKDSGYTLSVKEIITIPGGDGSSGAIAYSWLALMLMSLLFRLRRKV